jgi:uncharacterized protein YukE
MDETEIWERLGALTAKMEGALKALETANSKRRATDRRIEDMRVTLADLATRVDGLAQTFHGQESTIGRRLDSQDSMLDSIQGSLAFLRGGWKGAAAIGALLVGLGGVAAALAQFLGLPIGGSK